MLVLFANSLAALAVALLPAGFHWVAADDISPRFTVTTRKADDTVKVKGNEVATTFDIKSPSGIGRAVVERKGDNWPKVVIVRLQLKGLERLKISNGKFEIGMGVGVRAGKIDARQWKGGTDEVPLGADDPHRVAIRVFDKHEKPAVGIPLDGGHFEVALPAAFFKDNPQSLSVEWIDFYR